MTGEKIPEHEHVWDEHDICIGCPAERPAKTETPEHRCSISPDLAAEMEAARDQQSQPDDVLRTATGKVLTDADVQALADEAERGYDLAAIRPTYGIKPPQQHSLGVEDIRLTRARHLAQGPWPEGLSSTRAVLADLVEYVEEQRKSVTELAPSPTEALLAAARAVLAAAGEGRA